MLRKTNAADYSPTYLRDVIGEVLANNGVRPNPGLVRDLLEMVIQLRAEARADPDQIRSIVQQTLDDMATIRRRKAI